MKTRSSIPQVAVLVETSTLRGTQIVQGIAQFSREHGPWSMFLEPLGFSEQLYLPDRWRGSGVIACVTTRRLANQIASLQVPCVNVSWSEVPGAKMAQVVPDQVAIGQLAAQHLIAQGYRHFAYFGLSYFPNYTDRIGPAFAKEVSEQGHSCAFYAHSDVSWSERLPLSDLPDLDRWLVSLPTPVGILVWDFRHGCLLTEVCSRVNLDVPEDVGVIVGLNDDVLCEIATPPLSSVDAASVRLGYEAASLLSQLIKGSVQPTPQILIRPAGVTTRRSTNPAVIDDPVVAEAVSFIREHTHAAISVDDVVAAVMVSRRVLEQRFATVLGRSPAVEIRRAHLHNAMKLLSRTDLPIHEISAASGFSYNIVMNRAFRREVGMTPSAYRRQSRRSPTKGRLNSVPHASDLTEGTLLRK
jgi:LacI family transcriptional regulator